MSVEIPNEICGAKECASKAYQKRSPDSVTFHLFNIVAVLKKQYWNKDLAVGGANASIKGEA